MADDQPPHNANESLIECSSIPNINIATPFTDQTINNAPPENSINIVCDEDIKTSKDVPPSPLIVYQIKWVKWKGKDFPVITQNENGPCPLIALINALLLLGKVTIPNIIEIITPEQLIEYIADYILSHKPQDIPEEHLINYEQNVQDALALLPKLQTGLDVNIKFTGVKDFEYTPECIIFDLLLIPLYHGWLVDPLNEQDIAQCLGNLSYNQVVEKIVTDKNSEKPALVTEALIAENFIQSTSHQLTYYGLCELNAIVKEEDMAVLFRNNHFCTLTKHKDNLYTLATDQGYINEGSVMWETLSSVEGDESFVNGDFQKVKPTSSQHIDITTDIQLKTHQIENDYLVALSLQQEQQLNSSEESSPCISTPTSDPQVDSIEALAKNLTDVDLAKQLQAEEDFKMAEALARADETPSETPSTSSQCNTLNYSPHKHTASPPSPSTPNNNESSGSSKGTKKKCIIS